MLTLGGFTRASVQDQSVGHHGPALRSAEGWKLAPGVAQGSWGIDLGASDNKGVPYFRVLVTKILLLRVLY